MVWGQRALRAGTLGRKSSLEHSGEAGLLCPSTPRASQVSVSALGFVDGGAAGAYSRLPGPLLKDPVAQVVKPCAGVFGEQGWYSQSRFLWNGGTLALLDSGVLTAGCWPTDYMAHLVEVQHERGASGGQTFHSLLTASLPPRRGTSLSPCLPAQPTAT